MVKYFMMLPFSAFLNESDLLITAATIKLMEHRFGLINFIVKIMKKCDERSISVKVLDVGRYCTLADTTMLQYYNTEYRQNQHYPAQSAVLLLYTTTQHLQG